MLDNTSVRGALHDVVDSLRRHVRDPDMLPISFDDVRNCGSTRELEELAVRLAALQTGRVLRSTYNALLCANPHVTAELVMTHPPMGGTRKILRALRAQRGNIDVVVALMTVGGPSLLTDDLISEHAVGIGPGELWSRLVHAYVAVDSDSQVGGWGSFGGLQELALDRLIQSEHASPEHVGTLPFPYLAGRNIPDHLVDAAVSYIDGELDAQSLDTFMVLAPAGRGDLAALCRAARRATRNAHRR